MGKLLISHRSTIYPCFLPNLGEFNGSWSYKTYPLQKYNDLFNLQELFCIFRLCFYSKRLHLSGKPVLYSYFKIKVDWICNRLFLFALYFQSDMQ